MYMYVHIYIYIYIHTYIYTHLELGRGSQEIKAGVCIEERRQALLPVRARHELVVWLAQEMEQSHLWPLVLNVRFPPFCVAKSSGKHHLSELY
jgi:hypothetical protein